MNQPIVVAWTPDEFGDAALQRALREAQLRDASLVVVNGTRGEAFVDENFATKDQLGTLTDVLAASGVDHVVRQSVGNDVGDQVLQAAEDVDAQLIVLGVRRRSPVGKLLMGSVAQRILLGADCAVLAVKPPA